ncbi:tyrosine-type recombinase/integrase [Dactylosporangium sp. NPDC048998]|uniref:tyrosine-type recombinase/integrase n=1 Tax=Dactylosporangium sp. NPDC048998 TaxID=3363976 RepID=UPI003721719C
MNSYQVQTWEITKRADRKARPWRVRWAVDGQRFEEMFKTRALANSFRSGLIKAANDGEPFDRATGRPMSEVRARNTTTWYEHARAYSGMKWPRMSAHSRRSIVEALTSLTVLLISPNRRGRPDDNILRQALYLYAFNPRRWNDQVPDDMAAALAWLERSSRPIVDLADLAVIRRVLDGLCVRLDGKPAAATTVQRKRTTFYNALGYAVELGHLDSNPIDRIQWTKPEIAQAIDRRVVANPDQVAALLDAVRSFGKRAERVVAFFGCLYYAGMRPSEAADLRHGDCLLPATGWGKAVLAETAPHVGSHWTDDGSAHERRGLKHRARTETRPVPLPPQLVAMMRHHVETFGVAEDGRLFRGIHGGPLSSSICNRWWQMARIKALSAEQVASPLARRPYDLRHAAASLWLNAGVPPTEVARRLGHGVAVLLKVYANCVDGGDEGNNTKIAGALGA